MGLPNISVRRPVFTIMLFIAIIILGVISLTRLQIELYQGSARGVVSIIIRARGGLPPTEVEKMITKPVEEAVGTVSHLKSLYSNSREAESRVTMEFEPGTDMNFAALEVREKFSRVKNKLPKEIEKPIIANFNENDTAILILAATSKALSPEQVREIVDAKLKPLISRVDGVASVEVYGGRERKILIELDRDRMAAYNISIEQVMNIIGKANLDLLAGTVDKDVREFSVRMLGGFRSVEEIGEIGIATTREGSIIPLREIATIKDSYLEPSDYARFNLNENVSLYIKKVSAENTIRVAKSVHNLIKAYEAQTKDDIQLITVTDRAKTIEKAINDVRDTLYQGIFLTALTIFIGLRKLSLSLIVTLSIPTSIVATFIFMDFLGISLNIMTLSGLSLAIGMLVDSSIVVIENIFKKRQEGLPHLEAVVAGSEEVWLPLLASTVTTVAVFLPVIFIDKEIQLVYQGLAFTVTASLLASLFVSLMLIPLLVSRVNISEAGIVSVEELKSKKMYRVYRSMINFMVRNRYQVLLVITALFLASTYGLMHKDVDQPHTLEENEFAVVVFPLAGAKLDTNDAVAKRLEEMLHKFPECETISSVIRKDDLKIYVKLVPRNKRQHSKDEIMDYIRNDGQKSVKEVHDEYGLIVDEGVMAGDTEKLIVNIFGHETDILEQLAHQVAQRVAKIPTLMNIVMTDLRKRPEYSLIVDKGRAAYYGLTVKDIADSVHAQVRGMRPTKFHETKEGKEIEVITRLQAVYRQKIDDLKLIRLPTQTGEQILLSEVASFYPSKGPQTIDRKDKYRYVFVKADMKEALETEAKKVKDVLKGMKFPPDYYYRFGGQYEQIMKGKTQMTFALIVTILLIYMILACLFQSYSQPIIIMLAIPLASVGVWLGLTMGKKPLSNPVFIGMIMLAGIVVNNSIILIDRINILKKRIQSVEELVIQAAEDRLRPILMTAGSTIAGFAPMAFNWGSSSDLWSPLAITVMGGLASSTILTLFVIPVIYLFFEDVKLKARSLRNSLSRFGSKSADDKHGT
ncbi:MAG: efflux RND transporter permease subunit [Candidatus Omnitrophica bacterium]|nr:efflux RND transporter permease subunit [Candidatus Omnitrophota bacterium]